MSSRRLKEDYSFGNNSVEEYQKEKRRGLEVTTGNYYRFWCNYLDWTLHDK